MDVRVARLTPAPEAFGDRHPEFGLLPTEVAGQVARHGLLSRPDPPDGRGRAFLIVPLRPAATMRHYDPEAIDYWVTSDGRGERRTMTYTTPMPRSEAYSWGVIRLVDRPGIGNDYMTFGGHFDAASIDDVVVAAFASPAPLLRRGGKAGGWDLGADEAGAFFGRMMSVVDLKPAFQRSFEDASPLTRYAAFVRDTYQRWRRTRADPVAVDVGVGRFLRREATRLRATAVQAWDAAGALLDASIVE